MDQILWHGMPFEYVERASSFRKSAYFFSRIAMILEFVSFVMLWTMYIKPEELRKIKCAAWPYFFNNIASFFDMNGTFLFICGASIASNWLSGSLRRFHEFSPRRTHQGFVAFGNLFFAAADVAIHIILGIDLFEQKEGLYDALVFFTNDIMHSCVIPGRMIRSVVAIYVYIFLVVCRCMLVLYVSIIALNWLWTYIRQFNPYEFYYRYLEWRRTFLSGRVLIPSSPSADRVAALRRQAHERLARARARMGFPPTYEDMLAYDNTPPAYQTEDSEVVVGNSPPDSVESFEERIMLNDEMLDGRTLEGQNSFSAEQINDPEDYASFEERSNNNSNSGNMEDSFYDNISNDEILDEGTLEEVDIVSEEQMNSSEEDGQSEHLSNENSNSGDIEESFKTNDEILAEGTLEEADSVSEEQMNSPEEDGQAEERLYNNDEDIEAHV